MSNPTYKVSDLTALQRIQQVQQKDALNTLNTAHDLINKSYLAELKHYEVLPVNNQQLILLNRGGDVRIFRVERLVQENKQSVLESITAAYTALGAAGYSVFIFLKSDGKETLLYIGTRGEPGKMLGQNSGDLLQETFKGHFPGSLLQSLNGTEVDSLLDGLIDPSSGSTVTAVSSVPSLSTTDQEHFMQGLERFIDAAESRVYEGLILAEPVSMQDLNTIRTGYEQVATQLSSLAKRQYSYGVQDSEAVSQSISDGLSQSLGESLGLTETKGTSESTSTSTNQTHTTNKSSTSPDAIGKIIGLGAMALGSAVGGPLGAIAGGQIGSFFQKTNTKGTSDSTSTGESSTQSSNKSTAKSKTTSQTDTRSKTNTQGINLTRGETKQISFETMDKGILGMLDKIDQHLARINEAKSHGGWLSTAYFISDSPAASEALASIFLGLTRGTQSSTEDFALTTWKGAKGVDVSQWLGQLMHPRLKPTFAGNARIPHLTPATLVSSKEMAIQLSLPRRSTSTVVVQETAAFGRKIQSLNSIVMDFSPNRTLEIGHIRHLWTDLPQKIQLNLEHLTGHTFITGSTGSGKSNTVYELLDQLQKQDIPFLVIEPAKGEYKHIFGNRENVRVLGTNSKFTELLKINPFSFPAETHVLEHADRLIEMFNVCWPMYAAMPAILKDAVLRSYEACGWDLLDSTQNNSTVFFPTFADLLFQLQQVISDSSYSEEMKSNYTGALVTRIRSMVNGLNGQIFSSKEISNSELFDRNVIVDLSRIGSQETKSLIMGLLVIKLSEYRAEQALMNQPLRHVTVLEEAHNILRASNTNNGAEGGNVADKSVEILSNAIAEMRTFGEGFIIADQSPSAVHISAIRNTNTKILMRLPDEADRLLAGKSAALSNEQIDELARLPRGVAVIYQNEWLEAVLSKINHFSFEPGFYLYKNDSDDLWNETDYRSQLIQWFLAPRSKEISMINHDDLLLNLSRSNLSTQKKIVMNGYLQQFNDFTNAPVHEDNQFLRLANTVVSILGCEQKLFLLVQNVVDVDQMHVDLQALIKNHMGRISTAMALTVEQCLVKSMTPKGSDYQQLYAAWNRFITKDI
ncbi:helicase HerA domain-containing protein [Shewanella frigidimarina]|uniref:ATP-binding protein n=1 Tax=Shewanella frigidimarina TaxID=56812 RepID=UPI003D79F4C0|tara:strand:+ start:8528 stop:11788 length:3261 start_codon:yes stop_codon:yes gene_type:complete